MKRSLFLAGAAAMAFPSRVRAASLQSKVHAIAREVPGTIGFFCRTLAAGPPLFAHNAGVSFPTASTIKVLIMTTAYVLEEQNPGTLDRIIVTHRADLIGGSDFMARAYDGQRFTVRQLITPMIQLSDNTASNALIGTFGVDVINSVGDAAGMRHTHLERKFLDYTAIVRHEDNVTTPADMARLLYLIERGGREELATVVSPEHCRQMIRIMLGQTDRDGIPAGLPRGTQVANKTGAIDGTRNDIAIAEPFADSPYILTIFSKHLNDYEAMYHAMHRLAALSYALAGRSDA